MSAIDPAAGAARLRLPAIDAARAAAVAAMVVYHFAWDLRYFGYIAAEVESGFGWRLFARTIAGSFLALVGVSLVLAARNGLDPRRYLRRLALVGGSALAITAVTYFVFPETYIFFGILHHIAVASVLALPFLRLPAWAIAAVAAACFAAPMLLAGPAFDTSALVWLGLSTMPPRSNDFVPLFPWFGMVLAGMAGARLWLDFAAARLPGRNPAIPWPVLWAGRHSLAIYLLHQPLLFGAIYLAAEISPPNYLAFEAQYLGSCISFCAGSEVEAEICRATCECLAERSQAEGLWSDLMRQRMSPTEEGRYFQLVDICRAEAETR